MLYYSFFRNLTARGWRRQRRNIEIQPPSTSSIDFFAALTSMNKTSPLVSLPWCTTKDCLRMWRLPHGFRSMVTPRRSARLSKSWLTSELWASPTWDFPRRRRTCRKLQKCNGVTVAWRRRCLSDASKKNDDKNKRLFFGQGRLKCRKPLRRNHILGQYAPRPTG